MRKVLLIAGCAIVLVAGGLFAFDRYDRAQFGIPGFYIWRALSGQHHVSGRVRVNGISLYYETYGQGPPVLVVSGALGFVESMHPFIKALSPSHTVIAVDSRGQGRSTDGPGPITYAQMGDDMIKLLDALHIQRADEVGWSDGGIIGLDMAIKHPDRIRRLMVIGANYDPEGLAPEDRDPRAAAPFVEQLKPFYASIGADMAHYPVMAAKVMRNAVTEPHYTAAQLGQIRAPTLVVAGEHDAILRQHTDSLAAAIPGAKETIVAGASHFGPQEKPRLYGALAVKFLDAP